MALTNQSNNRNWGTRDNLAAAREFSTFDEINAYATTGAPDVEYPSDNYSPYEDSDNGSSLQEVKDEGNIHKAHKSKMRSVTLSAAIVSSSIGAVYIMDQMAERKPILENQFANRYIEKTSVGEYQLLTYDFKVSYKASATLFIDIRKNGEKFEQKFTLKWNDDEDVETDGTVKTMRFTNANEENLESPFYIQDADKGEYEFRVYCQYGFGKNSLFSEKGTLK